MKVPVKEFRDAIKSLSGLNKTRTTLPILSCVRVAGTEHGLSLRTTNLDQDLDLTIPIEGTAPEAACLPVDWLKSLAQCARTDEITFSAKRDLWAAESGTLSVSQKSLPASEFPPAVTEEECEQVQIPDFASRVQRVRHLVQPETAMQWEMKCTLHVVHRNGLSIVESHNTVYARAALECDTKHPEICLPYSALSLIAEYGHAADRLLLSENLFFLKGNLQGNPFIVSTKLAEMGWPNTDKVMGMEWETLAEIGSDDLAKEIRTARQFGDTDKATKAQVYTPIQITFGELGLHLEAETGQGTYRSHLPGQFQTAAPSRMNAEKLADITGALIGPVTVSRGVQVVRSGQGSMEGAVYRFEDAGTVQLLPEMRQ